MQQQINLDELDVKTLKAMAYDELTQLEFHQNNLRAINSVLVSKNGEQQKPIESSEAPLNRAQRRKILKAK